ncbi:hypothetical protein TNCV_3826071 [Trichonephila clavipes]|nr:hypothetical protein TNCV_3826071 [Trichonephila clavipes]
MFLLIECISADLSSFWTLGAEYLLAPLALSDQNSSLSAPFRAPSIQWANRHRNACWNGVICQMVSKQLIIFAVVNFVDKMIYDWFQMPFYRRCSAYRKRHLKIKTIRIPILLGLIRDHTKPATEAFKHPCRAGPNSSAAPLSKAKDYNCKR